MDGFGHQEAKSCCSAIAREKMPNIERQLEGGYELEKLESGEKIGEGRAVVHPFACNMYNY